MRERVTKDGVKYLTVPCLMIYGGERGWLDHPEYKEWVEKGDVAHWPEDAGSEVFTTYDNGEGCDNPEPMQPGPGIMPMWLWEEIKKVVDDAGLSHDYCVIRLMV